MRRFHVGMGALLSLMAGAATMGYRPTNFGAFTPTVTDLPLMPLRSGQYYGPGHDSKPRRYKHGMKNKARYHKTGRAR